MNNFLRHVTDFRHVLVLIIILIGYVVFTQLHREILISRAAKNVVRVHEISPEAIVSIEAAKVKIRNLQQSQESVFLDLSQELRGQGFPASLEPFLLEYVFVNGVTEETFEIYVRSNAKR